MRARAVVVAALVTATGVARAEPQRVIVNLRGPAAGVMDSLPRGFTVTRTYARAPAIAGLVDDEAALDALRAHPGVLLVAPDEPGGGALVEARQVSGANGVRALGLDGTGVIVAVIDSGVDLGHVDLAGDVIAERCFAQDGCPPPAAPGTTTGPSAQDEAGHGTNIAGIITGDGDMAPEGVAPRARIVAVRVLDAQGRGWLSDWLAGLDWVLANLDTQPVDVVNMSLATDAVYPGDCGAMYPAWVSTVDALRARGVLVVACAGNQGEAAATSAPACVPGILAVGATYDANLGRQPPVGTFASWFGGVFGDCFDTTTAAGRIACFSNSGSRVDLFAPGAVVTATELGGGAGDYSGTSQATAVTSGVAALLAECRDDLGAFEAGAVLVASGDPLTDPRNGLTFPSLDAEAAAAVYCASCDMRPDGAVCTDGAYCNGADTCQAGACALHQGDPCAGGAACATFACDEATRGCVTTILPGFCLVAGACVDEGAISPSSACYACQPGTRDDAYSPLPEGTSCPGGTCSAAGECVADDAGCGCAAGARRRAGACAGLLLLTLAALVSARGRGPGSRW